MLSQQFSRIQDNKVTFEAYFVIFFFENTSCQNVLNFVSFNGFEILEKYKSETNRMTKSS